MGPYAWWDITDGREAYARSTASTTDSASTSNVSATADLYPSGHAYSVDGALTEQPLH